MKRCGLIDDKMFSRLENLRKRRNNIHLKGLTSDIGDLFDDKDLEEVFSLAKEVTERVELSYNTVLK